MGDGPIVGASLAFYDRDGADIASFSSGNNADYRLSLRLQPEQFPLTIEAYGGIDLVSNLEPDFRLISVTLEPAKRLTANLNPYSTLIVQTARAMRGGPTPNNVASARTSVLGHFGFGLDRRLVPDPLQTPIDDTNVSVMVKTSEATAEAIRRTRDAMLGTGVLSADEIVEALAADLVDGVLDGRGASGTDARIAAVATLAAAQVLVESLTNELRVNGVVATAAMDNAIAAVRPTVPSTLRTGSVTNIRQARLQTMLSLAAAAALTQDDTIDTAFGRLSELQDDSLPADVEGLLPAGTRDALGRAIELAVYGAPADLERVNGQVRAGLAPSPEVPAEPAVYSVNRTRIGVDEGQRATFKIRRDRDTGEEYVVFRSQDDTAVGYDDYDFVPSKTVRFAPGDLEKQVGVDTFDDGVAEDDEVFRIILVEALDGGRIGAPASIEVTLRDTGGDAPPANPPPSPPDEPTYAAPVLETATINGEFYVLSWSHPREDLDGGFDVIVDGVDTAARYRTDGLNTTVGPLDTSAAHCFQIEARYIADDRFPRSNTLCVDPPPSEPPPSEPPPSDPPPSDPPPSDPPPSEPPPSDPPPAEPPGTDPYVAPVLESVVADGESYTLSWSHPRIDLDGGFDIIIDGVDTNDQFRTTELSAVVGPLDPGVEHCFMIEARYKADGEFPRSDILCADPQPGVNRRPTIDGQPDPVAVVGAPWQFSPDAFDADGDSLSFEIANKPAWASFDGSTGRLSGTPGPDDLGRHSGIVITVTDGEDSASLGPFAIEVREAATGTGSLTLSWNPPTVRTDGTPLDDLSGYRLYQGTDASNLSPVITLANPGLSTYVLEGLAAGEWTFAITALDSLGQESEFSNRVSTVVD